MTHRDRLSLRPSADGGVCACALHSPATKERENLAALTEGALTRRESENETDSSLVVRPSAKTERDKGATFEKRNAHGEKTVQT